MGRPPIDQMATVERDAVLLAYLGGHPCGEAARSMGAPEGTVKSDIRRGLLDLRGSWTPRG